MQHGRELSKSVDAYLKAIDQPKRRGRQLTPAQIKQRIADAKAKADESTGVAKVQALQDLRDLEARQAEIEQASVGKDDMAKLEAAFVKAAAEYSDAKGIDYQTWRQVGVPAAVLKKAGIR